MGAWGCLTNAANPWASKDSLINKAWRATLTLFCENWNHPKRNECMYENKSPRQSNTMNTFLAQTFETEVPLNQNHILITHLH